jgi:hypothetical protein
MLFIFGAVGLLLAGAAATAAAARFPERQALLERCAGGLFVGGLTILGLAFPIL